MTKATTGEPGWDQVRDGVTSVGADPTVAPLLSRYLPENTETIAGQLLGFVAQLAARRFIVPVIGMQGAGKSTFLNAVAFDRPVLPVDADETTAVPVEVVFAAHPSGTTTVHFRDGRTEAVAATEDALAAFVHNRHNPGNRRRVERIVVESDHDILRPGVVLVDLPGLGSLTGENRATTERYLDEAAGILVMLRTVPPLTRREAALVAHAWRRIPTAWFVQNRWDDEGDAEADEGRVHNARSLDTLARNHRLPVASNVAVHEVNAHAAWVARLEGRDDGLAASGLAGFLASLAAATRDWPTVLVASVRLALLTSVDAAHAVLLERQRDAAADHATLAARMEDERKRFATYREDADARIGRTAERCAAFRREQQHARAAWQKRAASALRGRMDTKLQAGIVDGPWLTAALGDEQAEFQDDLFGDAQQAVASVADELRSMLTDLRPWQPQRRDNRCSAALEASARVEAVMPFLGGAGGTAGGGWGGAKLGAFIGAAGGPAVAVIGGLIGGLLGGLLGSWLGRKGKEAVTAGRAAAARPAVHAAIDQFVADAEANVAGQVDQFVEDVREQLDAWRRHQHTRFETERDARVQTLQATLAERAGLLDTLAADALALKALRERLS